MMRAMGRSSGISYARHANPQDWHARRSRSSSRLQQIRMAHGAAQKRLRHGALDDIFELQDQVAISVVGRMTAVGANRNPAVSQRASDNSSIAAIRQASLLAEPRSRVTNT